MYFTTSWKLEGFEQWEAEGSIPSLRFHGRVGLAELELQMRTRESSPACGARGELGQAWGWPGGPDKAKIQGQTRLPSWV